MAVLQTGQDWDTINQALTTSYVEITYPRPIRNFIVQAAGDSNILVKRRSTDTTFFTLKGGSSHNSDILLFNSTLNSTSLGFFATDTGTDTAQIIVIFG